MIGHRLLANSLLCMGDIAEALVHLDRAFALYDRAVHRPLATRFGQDIGVAILEFSAISSVVARLSQDCLGGNRSRARRSARDGSCPDADVCAILHHVYSYLLRRSCGSEAH